MKIAKITVKFLFLFLLAFSLLACDVAAFQGKKRYDWHSSEFCVTKLKGLANNKFKNFSADSAKFSKYSPIVVDDFLMGGFYNNRWVSHNEMYGLINTVENYRIYTNGSETGVEAGKKVPEQSLQGFSGVCVEFQDKTYNNVENLYYRAMISNDSGIKFADAETLNNQNQTYLNFVSEYVASQGFLDTKLDIREIYRFDLESDGVDEVLINASTGMKLPFGDLLFMRKLINGKVENIILSQEFFRYNGEEDWNPLITFDVLFFGDLNHDGQMEIVTRSHGIDYLGYDVFELQGNQFIRVLQNGAGA